jgi:hypothetical protein
MVTLAPWAAADLRQSGAHRQGDVVGLPVAQRLVHQIHLDVALVRLAAQVVLAHQAVEVDRRRGAGVELVVLHFRHGLQVIGQPLQQSVGVSSVVPSGRSTMTWNSLLLSNGSIFMTCTSRTASSEVSTMSTRQAPRSPARPSELRIRNGIMIRRQRAKRRSPPVRGLARAGSSPCRRGRAAGGTARG